MATIKVPANTDDLKAKLAEAAKRRAQKQEPIRNPAAKEKADREAAARKRAKELAAKVQESDATLAEKDALIKELEDKLSEATGQVENLKPLADQWKKYEHVEKTRLIEKLPAELRKEAKDLPLAQLRTFTKLQGLGTTEAPKTPGKPQTEEEMLALAEKDPDAFLKALEEKEKK
jgi:hypothetical protein